MLECFNTVEEKTKNYNNLKLNVCFAYNSDYEIEKTIESLNNKQISLKDFMDSLMISDCPDIIVRTSNEIRLSNFLTIQSMKSQICFLE